MLWFILAWVLVVILTATTAFGWARADDYEGRFRACREEYQRLNREYTERVGTLERGDREGLAALHERLRAHADHFGRIRMVVRQAHLTKRERRKWREVAETCARLAREAAA